ncbi:MAG: hypothetical protein WCI04_05345 [archaeon]
MDARQKELEELKYEYDKIVRLRDNLQKNLERRKKLNLADESYEDDIKSEIEGISDQVSTMRTKIKKLESEVARSRVISESDERSPWEK